MKIARIALGLVLPVGLALSQKEPANQTSGKTAAAQSTSNTSEVRTYKGELVDASCAAAGVTATASAAKSPSQSAADRSTSAEQSAAKSGEASRSGESSPRCAVTSGTSAFGLRMKDGNTLRFDAVGNERAKEAIAAKKKWTDAISAGKPVQVAVSGSEATDRLTVISIH